LVLLSVEEIRDYSIIVYCILGAVLFFLGCFFTLALGLTSWGAVSRVRKILKESVQPAAANVKETTENVKGTVAFVSDNAVKPVVKAYGAAAGAKRFVSVAAKLAGRGKKEQ
jgi:nitrogen fixation/metabolism regulation signal transduction histidine kinase